MTDPDLHRSRLLSQACNPGDRYAMGVAGWRDWPELILAGGTLRGVDVRDRVAAASAAGFAGIGLPIRECNRLCDEGWTISDLKALFEDHGLRLMELEGLPGFAAGGLTPSMAQLPQLKYADIEAEERAFSLADDFGIRHVQATGAFTTTLEPDVVDRFASLCDRAAAHGLALALEFIPGTNIPTIDVASGIVAEADRPNGGLCVDSWHFFRGGGDIAQLGQVPGRHVTLIQIDDGLLEPTCEDYLVDTQRNRFSPGEGEFDLIAFLRTLWTSGADVPISVEVLSDELNAMAPREAASRMANATRAVVAAARALDD